MVATLAQSRGKLEPESHRSVYADGAAHAAHARLLEEQPTASGGDPYPLRNVLASLEPGQCVNCGVPADASTPDSARLLQSLVAPLPASPEARALLSPDRWAAEVLLVREPAAQLLIGRSAVPDRVQAGTPIAVDFTDVTGTYIVRGVVEDVRDGQGACLVIRCAQAIRLQLRRFVRVPVLVTPQVMEAQGLSGDRHAVGGQIIDLSLGGVGLLVSEPLPGGTRLRIVFELPGRFGPLEIRGRVVEPPGPAEAGAGRRAGAPLAYRRGAAFEPLGVDDLRRLQRALYHRQVELRRVIDDPLDHHAPAGAARAASQTSQRSRWHSWLHPAV